MYIKKEGTGSGALEGVLAALPERIAYEILTLGASRRNFPKGLCEIRLRSFGVCSLELQGESLPLLSRISEEELEECLEFLTEGSLYAYKDTIIEGYLPLGGGVRVGVGGRAGYDGDRLVGVREIGSLVFRFPSLDFPLGEELCELFRTSRSGMLIYSAPGVGKTTALRVMARILGSGASRSRVAIIDERCEFEPADYVGCEVDILRGYKRAEGLELAARTLSPELIMIDEIGREEAKELRSVIRCGIPVIATAHASSIDELFSKPTLAPMLSDGVFDLFVGLSLSQGEIGYVLTLKGDMPRLERV